jgi:hypothetical protein
MKYAANAAFFLIDYQELPSSMWNIAHARRSGGGGHSASKYADGADRLNSPG